MVFQEKALRQRASQSLARAASSRTGALPVDSPFTVVASGLLDSDAIPAAARTACLRKERRFMGSVLDLREATPGRRPGRRWRRLHSHSEGRRSNQRPRRPTGTHSCAIAWVKSNTFPRQAQGSRGASTEGSLAEVCLALDARLLGGVGRSLSRTECGLHPQPGRGGAATHRSTNH